MEEVSRASASVGLSYGAHSNLCVNQIHRNGSEAQKKKYLPKLVSGEHVGALAMSEPNAGSDVVSMQLRAEQPAATATCSTAARCGSPTAATPTRWWSTPRPTRTPARAASRPSSIEKGFKGLSTAQKLDKLGMRGSNTCELVLRGLRSARRERSGGRQRRRKVLMSGLDYERAVLSGGPLGIMAACMDVVLPFVHERKQFGQPIGEFQLMQGKLADMYTTWTRRAPMSTRSAKACDRGDHAHLRKDAAGAILYSAEKATWMAGEAIQALGGVGYTNEYPAGRLWRDAKLYEIGAGTSEIRRMLIGRELFAETA